MWDKFLGSTYSQVVSRSPPPHTKTALGIFDFRFKHISLTQPCHELELLLFIENPHFTVTLCSLQKLKKLQKCNPTTMFLFTITNTTFFPLYCNLRNSNMLYNLLSLLNNGNLKGNYLPHNFNWSLLIPIFIMIPNEKTIFITFQIILKKCLFS